MKSPTTSAETAKEPLQGQVATPDGLADVTDDTGGAAPVAAPPVPVLPEPEPPPPPPKKKTHACGWCGREFKSGPSLGGHKKNCPKRPPGGAKADKARKKTSDERKETAETAQPANPRPAPIPLGDAFSGAPKIPERRSADQAAQDAGEAVAHGLQDMDRVGHNAAGFATLMLRLQRGKVGVPELSALACKTALPPPLDDDEYQMLCAVWGDDAIDIPPNLLKALVTGSIFLPRLLEHETFGPQLKKLGSRMFGKLFGEPEEEPAPATVARPAAPPPPPPPAAQPDPQPTPISPAAAAAWGSV